MNMTEEKKYLWDNWRVEENILWRHRDKDRENDGREQCKAFDDSVLYCRIDYHLKDDKTLYGIKGKISNN